MLLLFNKSGSLECAKVVVLKLGAIRFYIAESILNFQNYEKKDIVKIRVSKFHKKKKQIRLAGTCRKVPLVIISIIAVEK